jgi:anti-sigma-K factor RskA
MRLFNFDDPAHRETILLLPWYVNGTLEGAERACVDNHVRECVACRRELEVQRQLRDHIRTPEEKAPAMLQGLARLHSKLDAQQARGNASIRAPLPGWRWWTRPGWLGVVSAAQLAIILMLVLLPRAPQQREFHTLAARQATASSSDAVVVIFDDATTQERMRQVLRDLQARIVDGPNSRGAYTLALPPGRQQAGLEALRRTPEVRFAQPAPGSDGMKP